MPEIFTAANLVALVTLTALEIVLGIDNIIFLSILTGKLKQPLNPVAVSCIGLEQLGQPVDIHLGPGQSPADVPGHVVVAEADRVGVAHGAGPHLGARPDADAGQRPHPAIELLGGLPACPFEGRRDPGRVLDRS